MRKTITLSEKFLDLNVKAQIAFALSVIALLLTLYFMRFL